MLNAFRTDHTARYTFRQGRSDRNAERRAECALNSGNTMRLKRDQARSVLTHAHHTVRLDHRGSLLLGHSLVNMMTQAPLTGTSVTILAESGETVQLKSLHETRACRIEVWGDKVLLFSGKASELIQGTSGPMQRFTWGHLTRIDHLARTTCSPWITYDDFSRTLQVCEVTVLTLGAEALTAVLSGCERSFDDEGVLYTSVRTQDNTLKLQLGECLVCLTARECEDLERSARNQALPTPNPAYQEIP